MTLESKVRKLEKTVEHLEDQVRRSLKVARKTNERCAALLANQKHYLRHRAPGVLKRQKLMMANAEKLAARIQNIPGIKHITTKKRVRGSKDSRHLLLVSGNEARKLRALARLDLRTILNRVSNLGKKRRDILGYAYGKRKPAH